MDIKTIRKAHFYNGVCIATLEIKIPDPAAEGSFGGFYGEYAERLTGWFDSTVFWYAAQLYDRLDDDRKRWRYEPVEVRSIFSVTGVSNDTFVFTKQTFTFAVKGEISRRAERTITWDTDRQRIAFKSAEKRSSREHIYS